ncbi:unnamed protein product [Polarella glacialis]|uniref:SecA family profile domain-containing protein n=1 Tax=Polarella glacialis TaxID=89957 RepID=A0A813DHL1_POLGL|nr:unnamed protein product [Polarella glacialis]
MTNNQAAQEEVNRIKDSVCELWSRQELRRLQDELTKLNRMAECFSAYPGIYSDEWRREISEKVEAEIKAFANKARFYLAGTAPQVESNIRDFAMQLILLGRIFDNLPRFKSSAVWHVNNMLEMCQEQAWGPTFLFKLGMILEQGKYGTLVDGKVTEEDERIGKVIVNEFRQFKDVLTVLWNQQTSATQKDVSSTLKEVVSRRVTDGDVSVQAPVGRDRLQQGWKKYTDTYEMHFDSWRAGELSLEQLAQVVISRAAKSQPCSAEKWTKAVKDEVPILLGGIFAYFTILKSGDSYTRILHSDKRVDLMPALPAEACHSERAVDRYHVSADTVLLRQHNIQILTILRLVGYDARGEDLANHLMQVRTGEGKSIILGAFSVLFGLLGFRVRCVCYSEYLSQRDWNLFKDLFVAFNLDDRIIYSKITEFSEDATLAKGNIRALTLDLINGVKSKHRALARSKSGSSRGGPVGSITGSTSSARVSSDSSEMARCSTGLRPAEKGSALSLPVPVPGCGSSSSLSGLVVRQAPPVCNDEELLLVDEVDVFFGSDFYGKTHNQVALLEADEVQDLLRTIWEQRDMRVHPKEVLNIVKESRAYSALVDRFEQWDFLVQAEVAAMCADLSDFDTPPYYYDRALNRIGYTVMDGMSFDVVFGYKTAFAYLNEANNHSLRDEEAALREALQLRVPCGQFSYANISPTRILGVSGTVEALGKYEWQVMNRYGIESYSIMPSVYGASNFRFLNQAGSSSIVISRASDFFHDVAREVNAKTSQGRAVIVFFKDSGVLAEFGESPSFKHILSKCVLRESLDHDEKDYVIKKAATGRQVTLTTAIFGRGTDFYCNDSKLEAAGGVHVIQAFFSTDRSEEVQIQGRTARQGKSRTYSLILHEAEIEKLGLNLEDLQSQSPKKQYECLLQAREKLSHKRCDAIEQNLAEATAKAGSCCSLDYQYFDALLASSTREAKIKFETLYKHVREAGARAARRLKKCRMICLSDATGSMGGIWGSARNHIQEMLKRIADIGGDGLELMWVAYRDYSDARPLEKSTWSSDPAVLQHFVNSIQCGGGGDYEEAVELALAEVSIENALDPVTRVLLIGDAPPHYERKGQKLMGHNHVLQTDYMEEASALASLEIPVYTFVVGGANIEAFEQIATCTGGSMAHLDSPDKLIDVVCLNALEEIGGSELVAEYKQKYTKA